MQQVAMSWLVYRLTGSAFLLGVIGFTSQIPTLIFAPFAGVLADRWNRRSLLIATQILAMAQSTVLAVDVLAGTVQVWHLIALSLVLGISNSVEIPVRQSFVVELVSRREDLSNAIALNSSMVQAARLIGPAIAGLLVASIGEGICFILNSLSYLAVLVALIAMRITPSPHRGKPHRNILHELREGFRYAFGFGPIRSILLMVALVSLTGMPYAVLVPVFAKEILHGGAHTYGFLMTAGGCGALIGTVNLASRTSVLGLGKLIVTAGLLFVAGISSFALSSNINISFLSLVIAGFGGITMIASSNTILQTILEEDKRGRVMSLFTVAFMGMVPFGSIGAGTMAGIIGPRPTLLIGAICCLVGTAVFAKNLPRIREKIRPIYIDMGIIKEVAEGMGSASEQPQIPDSTD